MKYPLGIQTFSEIRQEDYLYVDKTALIHQLITSGKAYFLSRPRRFGKSLLISTLEAVFKGEKSLFTGLDITELDYDFTAHPVFKLEFAKDEFNSADDLRDLIARAVKRHAAKYQVSLPQGNYNQLFEELVIRLHEKTGQKVVLLIDEYDKPILNNLDTDVLVEIKQVMSAFYAMAKSLDEDLKFIFITGVTKFSKVSVFSGMNNLTDISMNLTYGDLCGVTQAQLEDYFAADIVRLSKSEKLTQSELLAKIKLWYNGYKFHHKANSVYNPYSLLSLFCHQEFDSYWYATATPSFLIELIKKSHIGLSQLTQLKLDKADFMANEPEQLHPQPVMFQTGYLTIAEFEDGWYRLDFPNYEVKLAFNRSIVEQYAFLGKGGNSGYLHLMTQALMTNDLDEFFKHLRVFFANIPYQMNLKDEKYYQSLFYALFTLLGFQLEAEVQTNEGRIDCVLITKTHVYVIEFKLNGTKEDALAQIINNKYAVKYTNHQCEVLMLGVEFNQDKRNIGDYICQPL